MKKQTSATKPRWILPASVLLVVLCIAGFLDGMDVSSMGVVLPVVQHAMHMSPQALQWIISGYVLGYGGFMLLGGKIADLYGRRRVFLVSMALFAVASLAGGLATTGDMVIVSRIVKGICAGFTAPAALALLLGLYTDPAARNRALGIFSSTAAVGFALGVAIGGFLGSISWRFAFFLPVPFALAVVAVGAAGLAHDTLQRGSKHFDLAGAVLVTGGLLALVFGATEAATYGWLAMASTLPLIGGVALLIAFVRREAHTASPLMPLSIFRRPGLGFASVMAFCMQGNYVAYQFVAALYLQSVVGWSSAQAALAFVFAGLIVVFGATRFAKLALSLGPRRVVLLGMGLEALGFCWFWIMRGHMPVIPLMGITQLLIGTGVAAALPSINITGLVNTQEAEHGLASGIVLSAFQIGGGLIIAVVASIFATSDKAGDLAYAVGSGIVAVIGIAAAAIAYIVWQRSRTVTAVAESVVE